MLIRALTIMAALAFAASASAVEVGGVQLAEKASVGGKELVLNGAGIRRKAIFKVYVGSLYLPARAVTVRDALGSGPRRIQLNLLRNLSADQLIDALVDGLKENTTAAEMQAISVQTGELAAIMKSFGEAREGNVVTLDFIDGATKVGLNGVAQGSIDGEAFNRALTNIWIGEHPVQADLKKAMLGGA